jgi:3-hydroxyacyl-[acyl-carrier-protein] dehydratase
MDRARDEKTGGQTLPHRPPFRLVDRLVSADATVAVATRNITANDPLVAGSLPAVFLVEAMAQTAALHAGESLGPHRGYLVAVRDFHCEAEARVGDVVTITATRIGTLGALQRVHGEAAVDGRVIARGELTFAVEVA